MTTWVVDDGPLGHLAQAFDPSWSWPAATLDVLDAVVRGAPNDKSGRRMQLLAMGGTDSPVIVQHAVVVGSQAETYMVSQLRAYATRATADLGEHESIAWMLHEGPADSVFVTLDKGAAYLALVELGRSRVASPFDLWDDLEKQSLITRKEFEALCRRVEKGSNLAAPPRLRRPAS